MQIRNLSVRTQPVFNSIQNIIKLMIPICSSFTHTALPDGHDAPAHGQQGFADLLIPLSVCSQFLFPESFAGSWPFKKMTLMSMPETTMNEYNSIISWKHKVWLAWKIFIIKSEAVSTGMNTFADQKFKLGICPADSSHHPTARRSVNNIRHEALYYRTCLLAALKNGEHVLTNSAATASTTGTATELPNCLYA